MTEKELKNSKKVLKILWVTVLTVVVMSIFVSFTNNTSDTLLNLNNIFTVRIPENIKHKKDNYVVSEEIIQHFVLQGEKEYSGISGYIQVWQISSPLGNYIKQSEQNFSAAIYDYSKKPVLLNGNTGFEINFKISGDKFDTTVMQTLWQKGTDMYVISLSAPLKYSEDLENAFCEIRNSVTLTGESLPSGKLTEYCIHCI